jgi:hypothetical protein
MSLPIWSTAGATGQTARRGFSAPRLLCDEKQRRKGALLEEALKLQKLQPDDTLVITPCDEKKAA